MWNAFQNVDDYYKLIEPVMTNKKPRNVET